MKWLPYILTAMFVAGCGGAVQQSWTNFRAHYNTYYNAEKSFHAGQKKVLSQNISINPDKPVRVHLELPQTAAEEFQNTIDKGAQIIRRFPDSKWVDNALFLMGKSYYYRKEYYLGLQKFEELYEVAQDPVLRQKSVIWKGRTLLDLNQHSEGISFLEEELTVLEKQWEPEFEAETRVLIAEHHVMLGNWQAAHDQLKPSVSNLDGRSLKMRAYFLYAQVHEELENYNQAYLIFDRVTSVYTDYQYSYWAELSKGKIARKAGNLDQAYYIFSSMSKDDKNFERMSEIVFQIAKTEQALGRTESSEKRYKQLLGSTVNQPGPEIQSKAYYQLGKIYSDYYNDYEIAAAYFDSSSAVSGQNFEGEAGAPMASAYGSYASLKSREQDVDSLLALGSLNKEELDSTLQIIRRNRINRLAEDDESERNVLSNVPDENIEGGEDTGRGNNFGFLNYRNAQLASAASSNFKAIWGNRPLVDNWRRAEAIQGNTNEQEIPEINGSEVPSVSAAYSDEALNIDVSEIPRTAEEKRQAHREKANIQYQIGNLFFLTLNMPDSAETYFTKVIDSEYADEALIARTKYALYQVYKSNDQTAKADVLSKQILTEHEDTIYAQRIKEQENPDNSSVSESEDPLLQQFQDIEKTQDSTMVKARRYRTLALENAANNLAPHIHFRALQGYLNRAKANTDSTAYHQYWRKDSILVERRNVNPFTGAYWDSVRILVNEHLTEFELQPYKEKVDKLNDILAANTPEDSIASCSQLGVEARVKPDMNAFLSNIKLPEELGNQRLSGSISYLITISRTGEVKDFELQSRSTLSSLESAYNTAINNHLVFYPFEFENSIEHIQCLVSFPVEN
ncbi:MAG: hypothetical protein U5J95_05900 [Balneolaceae bacterium]|nr:hypothetical protein [Balneolaceae bacterium]